MVSGAVLVSSVSMTASTAMPSMSDCTSAVKTELMPAPLGIMSALIKPRGSRAPAARHVQVPSPLLLVSSISILRDTTSD